MESSAVNKNHEFFLYKNLSPLPPLHPFTLPLLKVPLKKETFKVNG
jgi:hypothetical protein